MSFIFHMFKHEEFFSAIPQATSSTNSAVLRVAGCLNFTALFFKTSNLVFMYITYMYI